MGIEIERKFLVLDDSWRADACASTEYCQGYLSSDPGCSVRVRVGGNKARLTIKGATLDVTRSEFEFPIPIEDARELLDTLCRRPLIEKTRHLVPRGRHQWEIDVFHGANTGLIVAEIELAHAQEEFTQPAWLGMEVSLDTRYYNSCLVDHPFANW